LTGITTTSPSPHTRTLDGLRGLAALNVVLCHFIEAFYPTVMHGHYPTIFLKSLNPSRVQQVAELPLVSLLYCGHFAVLIFFVLSGYVLALPYRAGQPEKLRARLYGRYLRLNIPVMAAVALSYAVFRAGLYRNGLAAAKVGGNGWLQASMPVAIKPWHAVNQALYQGLLHGTNTLDSPLWTLRYEFWGSLILLGLYLLRPARHFGWLMLAVCLAAIAVWRDDSVYYLAILLGSCLGYSAILQRRRWANALLLAVSLYLGAFVFENRFYDWLPQVWVWDRKGFYNALGALGLVAAVVNGAGAWLLLTRPVQYLGQVSFPMYLVHFIILASLACTLYVALPAGLPVLAGIFALYLLVTLLLAQGFERWVDRPAISVSHRFAKWLSRPA
jgi:peptidoglycan/LPS O-acetylase OafA/YrhL